MWRFGIQWKVATMFVLLILLAMLLISAIFLRSLERYYLTNFKDSLYTQGELLAVNLQRALEDQLPLEEQEGLPVREDMANLIDHFFGRNGIQVQVLDANGVILSASWDQQGRVGQKNNLPEINRALLGVRNDALRTDPVTGERILNMAIPIGQHGMVQGALYLEASLEEMYATLRGITNLFATGIGLAMLFTALLGMVVAQTITRPVQEITRQAQKMAQGRFDQRVRVYSNDEIGQLAQAFNELSAQLAQALSSNEEERRRLGTVLSNMSDGVLAVDAQGRIFLINERAREWLQWQERTPVGQQVDALLRPYIGNFSWKEAEGTYTLRIPSGGEERFLQMLCSPLRREGGATGMIAVLQDMTEWQRLEQQRRDFVADVSHELRTPLTTLRSYVEALSEGNVQDEQTRQRFLEVIRHEVERMIRIVGDLLLLSRLDLQEAPLKRPLSMAAVAEQAIERYRYPMLEAGISLNLEVHGSPLPVLGNRDQMEQVLDNLLSNALKYTPSGGEVHVQLESAEDKVWVTVRDTGIGIPQKDLERIFDRFYRVDKARSRQMGGTGLGLSIVKKVIEAHGGQIVAESILGKGTTIRYCLPLARTEDVAS